MHLDFISTRRVRCPIGCRERANFWALVTSECRPSWTCDGFGSSAAIEWPKSPSRTNLDQLRRLAALDRYERDALTKRRRAARQLRSEP